MKKHIKKQIRNAGCLLLFLVGVATLPLPFVPGIVFIALSLYLFSIHSPKTQKHIVYFRTRYIWVDRTFMQVERHFVQKEQKPLVPPKEEV